MVLNSYRMSHDLLLWLILGVTSAELRLHMPPSIAFATRGRLEGLRFQLERLEREFDDLDNENIRSLDSAYSSSALSEDEINAIPVRKYEIAGLQNESSTIQHASFSVEREHKKSDVVNKPMWEKMSVPCHACISFMLTALTHGFDNRGLARCASSEQGLSRNDVSYMV
ncbi:hypothetical protein MKW92_027159 [Papaver armeniacum]|nr:hypothetical protein MKW92_027159 [Papaver armeniacum]